jgi:DNA polymerase-3 subunit delta
MGKASVASEPGLPAVASAFLLYGEDSSRASEFVEGLRESMTASEAEPPHVERFYLEETPWCDILDIARTWPLFLSPGRLILVEEKAKKSGGKGGEASRSGAPEEGPERSETGDVEMPEGEARPPGFSKADGESLRDYLAAPIPRTTLVVLYHGKIPKTNLVFKIFEAAGSSVAIREFRPPKGADLEGWAEKRFAALGKRPGLGTIARLLETAENDAGSLKSEIEKLAVYVGDRKTVEAGDVDSLSGGLKSVDIWDITKALEQGDANAALKSLQRIFDEGAQVKNVLGVLSILSGFLRDLLLARTLLQEGELSREQVFAEVKPAFVRACRSFPTDKAKAYFALAVRPDLPRLIAELERIDLRIKTTDVPAQAMFEGFVLEFCRAGPNEGLTSTGRARSSRPGG